jgi:hypothetical protein
MNTYIVKTYRPDRKAVRDVDPSSDGYLWETLEVEAASATAALLAAGYPRGGATRLFQNHENAAMRDNAHIQTTRSGTVGAQAYRKDVAAEFEALTS